MRRVRAGWGLLCCCGLMAAASSCSLVHEDQSDCPPAGSDCKIDYELRLVTNMTLELNTQLNTEADRALLEALRNHLATIFTDYAHDVDLSFYDTQGDSVRSQHDEHIMDANQASYSLHLPIRQYMHLASANVMENPLVDLSSDERCHQSMLRQAAGDTLSSHTTGVYTARLPMDVQEGIDQSFNVRLYMANCATMLAIDPRSYPAEGIQVYTTGFASAFSICDSVFHYSPKPAIFRTTRLESGAGGGQVGFCSVTFPSQEPKATRTSLQKQKATRTVIETDEPFVAEPGEEALWQYRVYVPQADGTYTESILGMREPLRAGQLKVVKCWLNNQGGVQTDDQTVAISITLNWRPGSSHVVPL